MTNILFIGCTGNIGTLVFNELIKVGHNVRCVKRTGDKDSDSLLIPFEGITNIKGFKPEIIINLANFYQVPLDELLGLNSEKKTATREKITLDIRATNNQTSNESEMLSIRNFATLICARRRDWNGEVLSIRNSDLGTIGLLINKDEATAYDWLRSRSLLLQK